MGRAAVAITLSEAERRELEGLARRRKTAQGLARRARIVLAAADGLENRAIVEGVGAATPTRSASGVDALPSAGWTASTTNRAPGLRARSAMSRSRGSSAAPWKRRRPIARIGACARWPAPQAMRLRRSTDMASLRPAAASLGDVQAVIGPALCGEGARHRRPLP